MDGAKLGEDAVELVEVVEKVKHCGGEVSISISTSIRVGNGVGVGARGWVGAYG